MGFAFLTPTYDLRLVALSVIVAMFASFVALDLARRVHSNDAATARYWLAGGSIAMGTGIWSMHFVAMLAFSLPIKLGYDFFITFVSWTAAVGVSWIALSIASHPGVNWKQLGISGTAMGAGICSMHYIGMYAMQMTPGIVWHLGWLAISVVIAVGASFASLLIFFWMRERKGASQLAWQTAAAMAMGFAIAGMHYSGMEAAHFPIGSICRAANELDNTWFAVLIGGAAMSMLLVTQVASNVDVRLNAELERIAFLDELTQLPNRRLLSDRLELAIARARRERHLLALLFVNVDGLKAVNDSFGQLVGDHVLKTIAERLNDIVRASETIARFGADQFVVLVEGAADRSMLSLQAERIETAVGLPIAASDQEIRLSASIGIALFPDDASDANQLLMHADIAMHAAKAAGTNIHRFHERA